MELDLEFKFAPQLRDNERQHCLEVAILLFVSSLAGVEKNSNRFVIVENPKCVPKSVVTP